MHSTPLVPFLLLLLVPACARTESVRTAPPLAVTSASVPRAVRGLYRLDFVLSTKDAGTARPPETFSYVVEDDGASGEINSGVPDLGLQVKSNLRSQGPNVVVDVELQLNTADARSTPGPVTIRKFASRGKVLLAPGKTGTVVSLDEAQKHYDLAVTATQVR